MLPAWVSSTSSVQLPAVDSPRNPCRLKVKLQFVPELTPPVYPSTSSICTRVPDGETSHIRNSVKFA